MFRIVFVYRTVADLALWLQQTNKVYLLTYLLTDSLRNVLYMAKFHR